MTNSNESLIQKLLEMETNAAGYVCIEDVITIVKKHQTSEISLNAGLSRVISGDYIQRLHKQWMDEGCPGGLLFEDDNNNDIEGGKS